jgi:ubiquitin carboxyl-terminal hydrolase 7
VLHLHLKRFALDPYADGLTKVCERQTYPLELDMAPYLSQPSPPQQPSQPSSTLYHLHGVLVHRGRVHSGHYYAFLRPTAAAAWFKFDDATVVRVPPRRALQDNFGSSGYSAGGVATAYMLVYLRDDERARLLAPQPLPDRLRLRLQQDDERDAAALKGTPSPSSSISFFIFSLSP